jgi:hypothetical protein
MQTAGLPWRFCSKVSTGDPGGGGLRYNGDSAATSSIISLSDACLDRRNPDVSRYVATWDKSTNHDHRGTLILTSATREGLAIFEIAGTSTDREGWTELAVRPVQSFDAFENNEEIRVQFLRTGDTAGTAAVREIVREIVVQSVTQPTPPDAYNEIAILRAQVTETARALADTREQLSLLQGAIAALVQEATAR